MWAVELTYSETNLPPNTVKCLSVHPMLLLSLLLIAIESITDMDFALSYFKQHFSDHGTHFTPEEIGQAEDAHGIWRWW